MKQAAVKAINKRVTITDVANSCGLSKTTVSKVMNVPAEKLDVPESTRQRVLEACNRLGYRPSWRARAFASRRTQTIGLIHRNAMPFFGNEIWLVMLEQLITRFHERGYDLQFVPAPAGSDRWKRMLLDERLDGCVVTHDFGAPDLQQVLAEADLPTVLLNGEHAGIPNILPDDLDGSVQATRYLLSLGHRAMAFAESHGPARHISFRNRREGFRRAMTEAGHGATATLISAPADEIVAQIRAMRPRPTAVLTYDDFVALRLLHVCWEQGIKVPDDLSVATFNDVAMTRFSIPALTAVRLPVVDMAKAAVDLLMEQIESGVPALRATKPPAGVVLPETLVVRASTGVAKHADV